MQAGVEKPGRQQIGRDEDEPPARVAKHADDVRYPRDAGGDAAYVDLTDTFGQHRCG